MNVKVKTEPGEGEPKKAGQGQFKPKIPPKKKQTIQQTDNVSAPSTTIIGESSRQVDKVTSQRSSSSSSSKRTDINRNPQEFKGQNRQKWVMPIGQSFFMSQKISITNKKSKIKSNNPNDNNTTNTNGNNNPQQSLQGNGNPMMQQPIAFSGYPLGTRRIIDDYEDGNMNVMNMGSYSFGVYNDDDELIDTDTGSDSSDSDDDIEEKTDIDEIWPPQKYDMLEPLSLPLGPTTTSKRDELERQAIIYHPDDAEALEREKSDLFLLQLPSDLCLKSNIANGEVNDDNIDDESKLLDIPDDNNLKEAKKVEGKIGPSKLGKLQLTRSGKVFLVTENGKRFEVNNGITACFANFVAGIELNDNMNDDNNMNNGDDNRKKSKTYFSDKKGNSDAPISGDLNILGRITKKLVITPDYYCS